MLSLDECRRILGTRCSLSESELEVLRNLAIVAVEGFSKRQHPDDVVPGDNSMPPPCNCSEEAQYAIAERAAILEFDAGMTRGDAEQTTRQYCCQGPET